LVRIKYFTRCRTQEINQKSPGETRVEGEEAEKQKSTQKVFDLNEIVQGVVDKF